MHTQSFQMPSRRDWKLTILGPGQQTLSLPQAERERNFQSIGLTCWALAIQTELTLTLIKCTEQIVTQEENDQEKEPLVKRVEWASSC